MCCTASSSSLEQARIAVIQAEQMEMRPGMIIENTVLPGSRLRLSCGEVKSPAKCTFSQSKQFIQYVKTGFKILVWDRV